MKITITEKDSNYHGARKAGNYTHGHYILHNVDVFAEIQIDGESYCIVWQTGQSYDYGDYNCPSARLDVSEAGGSSALITLIDEMYEGDFDDDEVVAENLACAQSLCAAIKTADDLFQLYQFVRDEHPSVLDFIPGEYQSDDLDDYDEEEITGWLVPINI